MYSSINEASLFLIKTVVNLYILVLMLRFILPLVKADYYNPISQLVLKLTDPIVLLVHKLIPLVRQVDVAVLLTIAIINGVKLLLLFWMTTSMLPNVFGLLFLTLADLLMQVEDLFFFAIIIVVIISWLNPGYNPGVDILIRLTEPLMRPVRRIMPNMGGFDLSPIPVLIGLKLVEILFIQPIYRFALAMAAS